MTMAVALSTVTYKKCCFRDLVTFSLISTGQHWSEDDGLKMISIKRHSFKDTIDIAFLKEVGGYWL
jgi:hypothetical protein